MKLEDSFLFDVKKFTKEGIKNKLTDRFLIPPFSVFDTKQGYWQNRKRLWAQLGIKSEIGRGDNLLFDPNSAVAKFGYDFNKDGTPKRKTKLGKCLPESIGEAYGRKVQATSIFDPVLCELIYRWFTPVKGKILDPFAGGSVRGIVAAILDYEYVGVELRKEQVEANQSQMEDFDIKPTWITGNSLHIERLVQEKYDLIFTCPPYYNLEVYSDLDGELSAFKTYEDFLEVYGMIIQQCVNLLKDNRFACFVVGDIRDDKGFYRGLVKDTINLFKQAKMGLYNEAILVNVVGSLPVRIANCFKGNRKIGKMHQNILVFYKGDPDRIKIEFPEIKNLSDE